MSDWPMVHTLHGPFTQQASMLYRRIARRHWFLGIARPSRTIRSVVIACATAHASARVCRRWRGGIHDRIGSDL